MKKLLFMFSLISTCLVNASSERPKTPIQLTIKGNNGSNLLEIRERKDDLFILYTPQRFIDPHNTFQSIKEKGLILVPNNKPTVTVTQTNENNYIVITVKEPNSEKEQIKEFFFHALNFEKSFVHHRDLPRENSMEAYIPFIDS